MTSDVAQANSIVVSKTVPQGTEISLTGKDIVLKGNLAVSSARLAHHETETKHPPLFELQQEMQY